MCARPFSARPDISIKAVAVALSALTYTASGNSNATDLYNLVLVNKFLQDSGLSPNPGNRRYAFSCILVGLITHRMNYLSSLFQLSPPEPDAPYHQGIATIKEYSSSHNPELIGWCWLYFRYVRSELGIKSQMFSRLCHITERTLRRYQTYAIERLTDMLIDKEWEACQLHHFTPGHQQKRYVT